MTKDLTLTKTNNGVHPINEEVFDTKKVVNTLERLMVKVTDKDMTADTVNAACNCADKIVDILRLHIDVARLRSKKTF